MSHEVKDIPTSWKINVLAAMILLGSLAIALCGCGDPMVRYDQSVASAAIAASTCRETLSDAHEQKTTAIRAKAEAGDKVGAKADFDSWMPTYGKVKIACTALRATAEEALAARPVVAAAVSKDKDVAAWIARLAALGLDTVKILTEAGLKPPGVK